MAVPKHKKSRSRTRHARSRWLARIKKPNLVRCPKCGALKLPHRACPNCGYYNEKIVLPVEVEE